MARPPRCLVADLETECPSLDDAARHHLGRVLRLRDGELVELVDGEGGWASAHWSSDAALRVIERRPRVPPPSCGPSLWVAPPKGARLDGLVEKAVELGALQLGLLTTRYSGRPPSAERWQRLRRKADEALMQCRGLHRLQLHAICPLETLLAETNPRELWYGAAPEDFGPADADTSPRSGGTAPLWLLVGPEGGWAPEELQALRAGGGHPCRLGSRVLRVETAAIALLAVAARVTDS